MRDQGDAMNRRTLTLGHSPDPDDAFMFHALATGRIDTRGWTFEHVLQDIQTLNDRTERGELDISAISIHAYPFVSHHYALLSCGCSMGDGYGPLIVAREPGTVAGLGGRLIAVPGTRTTAFLALNLLLGRENVRYLVVPFDQIIEHVVEGRVDAGLVIHEGQLTYDREHLHKIVDLGEWWMATTGLPLPLGGNVIRRDLGGEALHEVAGILKESIRHGLAHRTEAVTHALLYGRGLDHADADRFVGMYVNEWTIDYGERGRQAVRLLLDRASDIGLTPRIADIDFVG
jgi:1,4-dihydroxy-6-naphthoate synthase